MGKEIVDKNSVYDTNSDEYIKEFLRNTAVVCEKKRERKRKRERERKENKKESYRERRKRTRKRKNEEG